MAVAMWHVEIGTPATSSIAIWIKTTDGANVTWLIDGDSRSVATSGLNNTGSDIKTGLTAGQRYPIVLDGTDTGYTVLVPRAGDAIRIMHTNCFGKTISFPLSKVVEANQPDLFVWGSDNGYTHFTETLWGHAVNRIEKELIDNGDPPSLQDYYDQYESFLDNPGVMRVNHQWPQIWVGGNHDTPGDRDDHTITGFTSAGGTLTNQGEANITYVRSIEAQKLFYPNAPYVTANDGLDLPYECNGGSGDPDGTPVAADYAAMYYSFILGDNLVEVVVLDGTGGKHPNDHSPEADRLLLGATQRAWAVAIENATVCDWVHFIIAYPPTGIETSALAFNGWGARPTDWHLFYDSLDDPKRCIFGGGDWHSPSLQHGLPARPMKAYNGGPGGQAHNIAPWDFLQSSGVGGDMTYTDRPQSTLIQQHSLARLDFTPDDVTVSMINSLGEATIVANTTQADEGWNVTSVTTFPTTYNHTINTEAHCGNDDGAGGWDDGNQYMLISGTSAPLGRLDGGAAFLTGLAEDAQIRWAELSFYVSDTNDVDNFLLFLETPGTKTETPWGASNLPKNTAGKLYPQITITEAGLSDSNSAYTNGLFRVCIDVTDLIQAMVDHANYDDTHYANFGIWYDNISAAIDLGSYSTEFGDTNAPQLVVNVID